MSTTCPTCKETKPLIEGNEEDDFWWYSYEFDSFYCPKCWIWVEPKCKGPRDDPYCKKCLRPDNPERIDAKVYFHLDRNGSTSSY